MAAFEVEAHEHRKKREIDREDAVLDPWRRLMGLQKGRCENRKKHRNTGYTERSSEKERSDTHHRPHHISKRRSRHIAPPFGLSASLALPARA